MTKLVKAEIKKKDGTHIVFEGSEEEVKRLLDLIREDKSVKIQKAKDNETKKGKLSIGDMILELREEGFFAKPKSLVEIKNALSEKGRIYDVTTLSTQVIRQVRKRNLGRLKQDKKWMYVKKVKV